MSETPAEAQRRRYAADPERYRARSRDRMREAYRWAPERKRAEAAATRAERVGLGLCLYCGKEDAIAGRRYGEACKDRNRGRGPSRLRGRRASTPDGAVASRSSTDRDIKPNPVEDGEHGPD